MKLYATTTSERATKGQGGNEFLDIKIYRESKTVLLHLKISNKNTFGLWIDKDYQQIPIQSIETPKGKQ